MPTVIVEDGFRLVIFTHDHGPAHVHVIKNRSQIRIILGAGNKLPRLDEVIGKIGNKDVQKAYSLVLKHHGKLIATWKKYHK